MSRGLHRRWSVAAPQGRRGAGLGNEIISLGKAYIGASELGATLVEQPWWLNRRRYGNELGHNAWRHAASRLEGVWLPRIELTWPQLAFPWDYRRSMEALRSDLPPSCVVVHASGMAGGYLTILSARPFLQQRLGILENPRPRAGPLRVGLHLRTGDFTMQPVRPGVFNARLSARWIVNALVCTRESWAGDMELTIVTDATQGDPLLREVIAGIPPGVAHCVSRGSVLGDLRRLAASDIIVPSVSSYSMMAIFLSDAAYLWPRHQLHESDGWLTIWGQERDAREGPTARNVRLLESESSTQELPRGLPLGEDEYDLRTWLRQARQGLPPRDETDLVLHGVVRSAG